MALQGLQQREARSGTLGSEAYSNGISSLLFGEVAELRVAPLNPGTRGRARSLAFAFAEPLALTVEWVARTCLPAVPGSNEPTMNLDDQIRRYFGASDLASVPPQALEAGIERMKVDLGLTRDRGERFALWALLHALGSAPDLDVAFETEAEREAARNFMDLIQGASGA